MVAKRNGVVIPLQRKEAASIDVRSLLLDCGSTPVLKLPKEVQQALDARARDLAQEAYELCREHLQRRVAHCCVGGYPVRTLNVESAHAVIAEGDLGDALSREWQSKMNDVHSTARQMALLSNDFLQKVGEALEGGR